MAFIFSKVVKAFDRTVRTVEEVWECEWAGDALAGFSLSTFLSPATHAGAFLPSTGVWIQWAVQLSMSTRPSPIDKCDVCHLPTSSFSLVGHQPLQICHSNFGEKNDRGSLFSLPCLCTTEKSPFVLAWKVTGLKCDTQKSFFQRGKHILENHLAPYLLWISALCSPPAPPHLVVAVFLLSFRKLPRALSLTFWWDSQPRLLQSD